MLLLVQAAVNSEEAVTVTDVKVQCLAVFVLLLWTDCVSNSSIRKRHQRDGRWWLLGHVEQSPTPSSSLGDCSDSLTLFIPRVSPFLLSFCCLTNQHSLWLAHSYCFSADFAFLQSRWVPWGWGSLLSLLPFSQLQAVSLGFHTAQRQPWSNRHRAQPPKLRC